MKHLPLIALAFLATACQKCERRAIPTGTQGVLIWGQSLASGNFSTSMTDTPDSHIKMFKNGSWQTAVEPIATEPDAVYGPGVAFAQEMRRLNPSIEVGIINCAVGGTDSDQWAPRDALGAHLFSQCIDRVRQAQQADPTLQIAWVIGNQGQSDANAGNMVWTQNMTEIAKAFHAHFGKVPVVYAQLENMTNTKQSQSFIRWFREDMGNVRVPNTYMIITSDLNTTDGVHLDGPGQQEQGKRFARAAFAGQNADECKEMWWTRILH